MKTSRILGRLALLGALVPATVTSFGCGGGGTTVTPSPTNYRLSATLDYSAVSTNSNAFTVRIVPAETSSANFAGEITNRAGGQNVAFGGLNRIVNTPTQRSFSAQLASPAGQPFVVGQIIPLALGTQSNILLRQSSSNFPNADRIWNSDGGTATVTSVGTDSIAVRLDNARFVPSSAFFGTGTFLLNGTLSATGLRVLTN